MDLRLRRCFPHLFNAIQLIFLFCVQPAASQARCQIRYAGGSEQRRVAVRVT